MNLSLDFEKNERRKVDMKKKVFEEKKNQDQFLFFWFDFSKRFF